MVLDPYANVRWKHVESHLANFHAHTSNEPTDGHSGADAPESVIDEYAAAGYSVLTLTEHEYNVTEPTWPWTDWDRDPDELEMIALQGVELTVDTGSGGFAHDVLSLETDLASSEGMDVSDVLAEIDDRGGAAILPHPGRYHEPDERGFYERFVIRPYVLGLEVVNATDRYPTDRELWDALLTDLGGDHLVWGFANDDYHGRDQPYGFDNARNVLLLEELTPDAVREALRAGRFYTQQRTEGAQVDPPRIESIVLDPDEETITLEPVESGREVRIEWIADGMPISEGPTMSYGDVEVGYARGRVIGPGGVARTQPFGIGSRKQR